MPAGRGHPTIFALAAGLTLLAWCGVARAHAVGISQGDYVAKGAEVTAQLTFARGELAALVPDLDANHDGTVDDAELAVGSARLESVLTRVELRGDGAPCAPALDSSSLTEQDGVVLRGRFTCPSPPSRLSVRLLLLADLPHGHRHVAHVEVGGAAADDLLYRGHDTLEVVGKSGASATDRANAASGRHLGFFSFLRMGIEHILTGYDHLVFLLGLILVGGRVRSLIGVVTAFTVAHSMTLALAALDVWSPPPRVVEAAIAASIVYVGVENFFVKSADKRWRITFPFGLVHGFGFASALREISLTRAQIPVALVSFNLGVEVGQLAVMAIVLPLVLTARKRGWLERRGTLALSAAVAAAGAVWFVSRVASTS
jgi:hydrogenase/urease accessory protein HupE